MSPPQDHTTTTTCCSSRKNHEAALLDETARHFKKNLNTREAAAFLEALGTPFSPLTLEVWRCQGKGPEFKKVGHKIFYSTDSLRRFAEGTPVKTCDSMN